MIKITHAGEITIGNMTIPCYVTENGQRIISARRMQDILKIEEDSEGDKQKAGARFPRFLGIKSIKSLINKKESMDQFSPVIGIYQGRKIHGSSSEALIKFCDIMIEARNLGLLKTERQRIVARQAEIIISSLAKIGIIALIDEATGYQDIRQKDALQVILNAYLSKELAAWAKKFPDEFYKQIFRLKGWNWPISKKPLEVGRITKDIVYKRLAPGIVEELEQRNPCTDKGYRKVKHHQYLSNNIGHPALSQHIHALTILMRSSSKWDQFYDMVQVALPVKNEQLLMELEGINGNVK